MPKKWGGKGGCGLGRAGLAAGAAQVSCFRGAGNNSLLSEENVNLFLRKGIITSVSNTTEDVGFLLKSGQFGEVT